MQMTPQGGGDVLVLQHLAAEDPGSLGPLMAEAGMHLTVVELDEGEPIPSLDEFDLMLVMGGPMDVWQEEEHPWLATEKAAIREWVRDLGKPYLGVCLGHQLLADALGGSVGPMPSPEVGVMDITTTSSSHDDAVFSQLPLSLTGLQWHGAQVLGLPTDGVVLATNSHCAVQAMRVGHCAWGVQFHVEVQESTVAEWTKVPEYHAALAGMGRGDADWLHQDVARHMGTLRTLSEALLSGILGVVSTDRQRRAELAS